MLKRYKHLSLTTNGQRTCFNKNIGLFIFVERSLVMAAALVYLVILFGAAGAGIGMYYGLKAVKLI